MINLDNVSKIDLELTGGLSAVVSKAELNAITVKNKATAASAADLNRNNGLDAALTTAGKTTAEYIDKIVDLTGMNSSASEIDGSVNLAHPSLNNFLFKAEEALKSISILVNSDSTGNGNDEWVYFFSQWLGIKYPKYTVRYRVWDETTKNYLAPISMNTGTTSLFLDVWNFAVAGAATHYILGMANIVNSIKSICNKTTYTDVSDRIDLIISNHGHNVWNDTRDSNNILQHAMFTETILQYFPHASFMQIRQNPFRDDFSNAARISFAVEWAMSKGFCIANAWDKFIALNKASYLYADNIHPSGGLGNTGTQLMLDSVTEQLNKKPSLDAKLFDSSFNIATKSVLPNPNFATWTNINLAPDGYTVTGGTCLKDTIIYDDTSKQFSCKVIATGGTACNIKYEIFGANSNILEGGWYTCAIKMKVDTTIGNVSNAGRISFISNTDTITSPNFQYLNGTWHYRLASVYLKNTDSYLRVQVHVDSSNTALVGQFIHIDSIVVCKGKMPYGISI